MYTTCVRFVKFVMWLVNESLSTGVYGEYGKLFICWLIYSSFFMFVALFLGSLFVARKHVLGVVSRLGRVPPSSVDEITKSNESVMFAQK